ncbi:MAG TPA: hypothetical protein VK179_19980 [Bacteroidales bacterium]|nr:hypothetical protein [Bacteroidales bacterium]
MARVLLLSLLIFNAIKISSQEITWGELNKSLNENYSPQILKADSNYIYTLASDYTDFYIEKFDINKMTPVYSTKVIKPQESEIELINLINDKFIVFYSFYNENDKTAELRAFAVDAVTGRGIGTAIKLMKLPVENSRRAGEFSAITSQDGKMILVNHYCYIRNKRIHQNSYVLFNDSLQIVLDKTERIESDELNYKTFNYQLDNNGSVYFMKASREGLFIASYDVFNNYEKWEEKIDFSEQHPNTILKSAYLGFNNDQNLVVTGLYGLTNKNEGLYFLEIDRISKEIMINRFSEFSDSLSQTLDFSRPDDPENMNYSNIISINKKDGGMYLFCERYDRRFIAGQYTVNSLTWFNDVAIFDLTKDGTVLHTYLIPKSQYNKSSVSMLTAAKMLKKCEYLSILPWTDDSCLYVAYNDHIENVPYLNRQYLYKRVLIKELKNSVPVIITINKTTGEIIKNKYTQLQSEEIYFKPQVNYPVPHSRTLFIFAQKGLQYRFGRLTTE